jgi:hypothetical protein
MEDKFVEEVQDIFSHAMALEQDGRQKNMLFCFENFVYTLNADKTMLLRFVVSKKIFKEPVGFFASDYDSPDFTVENGAIVFHKKGVEFDRKKSCKVPDQNFKDAETLYQKFITEAQKQPYLANIVFYQTSTELFDSGLSHIEFRSKEKKLFIIQRDIFSGSIIELTRKPSDGFGLGVNVAEDDIKEDFGPLGMRTGDLMALFALNKRIKINFLPPGKGYFVIEGDNFDMTGIVAGCLYDDIGELYKL